MSLERTAYFGAIALHSCRPASNPPSSLVRRVRALKAGRFFMSSPYSRRLSIYSYVIGGLSYVPILGILFGSVAVIWGFVTRREDGRVLALEGLGGIAVNVVCLGALLYFGASHDIEARTIRARQAITSVMYAVEFYKIQEGQYPADLYALQQAMPDDLKPMILDPMKEQALGSERAFHYRIIDEHHYSLRGAGADGLLSTGDDIVPIKEFANRTAGGLVVEANDVAERRGQ
jgi:hypothetical protein